MRHCATDAALARLRASRSTLAEVDAQDNAKLRGNSANGALYRELKLFLLCPLLYARS